MEKQVPKEKTFDLSAIFAKNRAMYGDLRMEADPAGAGGDPAGVTPPAGGAGADDDAGKGGKSAVLADLAKERDERQKLQTQIETLQASQTAQRDAFAAALGVKPDQLSDTDKLTAQLTDLSTKLSTLTKDNLVLKVAEGLSDEDRAIIAALPDEATMRTVAARLKAATTPTGKPKPDPSSGGGTSGGEPVDMPGVSRLRAAYAAAQTN